MNDFINNINFEIALFWRSELGPEWDTKKFKMANAIIPFARLYYPLEGCGFILHQGRRHQLLPGKVYLVPPYADVEVSCPKRLVKYWGHFNAFILDSDLDIFSVLHPPFELPVDNPGFYQVLLDRLTRIYNKQTGDVAQRKIDPLRDLEGKSALSLLLMPFLNAISNEGKDDLIAPMAKFGKLLAYIELNLAKGLSLDALADVVNLNPTYLSNLFAKEMGIPLVKYCNERRIRRAINLLWGSSYSFSEIAYKVGAENVTAFSRLFKRHTGITPMQFKRQIRDRTASGM